MFRRNPTRIETKLDDLKEYEDLKKKLDLKSNKSTDKSDEKTNGSSSAGHHQEKINIKQERIGFRNGRSN